MKTLLVALLFCLYTLTSHAQTWPRNPKTGKVEFTGVLPWPATVKTEAQRRALVRRWYLAKLTDSTPSEVDADAATNRTNGLLTYAGLPVVAVLRNGTGGAARFLVYHVSILGEGAAAKIKFSHFEFSQANEDGTPLESHLSTSEQNEKAALAELQRRLAVAVKAW